MNSVYILNKCLLTLLMLVTSVSVSKGQLEVGVSDTRSTGHDTTYFTSYSDLLVGRVYTSQKFTRMYIANDVEDFDILYKPNTSLNLGVGVTYKWATLNLAYGFGFLNPENGKGETKYLDLQFHSYGSKIMLDVFGQFYKGFYLEREDLDAGDEFYSRPDLDVFMLGGIGQYVFNNKKFSYRSSFMQNEWQKKSAGSFLLGAEVFVGNVRSDSTAIPTKVDPEVSAKEHTELGFFELGPNVGYAHTFVINGHWFIHGSAGIGITFGNTVYDGVDGKAEEKGVSPNSTLRLALGYNSEVWIFNILLTNSNVDVTRAQSEQQLGITAGNIRVILAKRFFPGKKLQNKLNKLPSRN